MAQSSKTPACKHAPPRKHVLLLSCMDQRLLDDTVAFMDSFNLANRYDQVVFAGASLGVVNLSSPSSTNNSTSSQAAWKDVFFHHLRVAIDDLGRKIKDIFILEHRDCGAYELFHPTHKQPYNEDENGQHLEKLHHCEQAHLLESAIHDFCNEQRRIAQALLDGANCEADRNKAQSRVDAWTGIKVKSFLMDLTGDVEHLCFSQPSKKSVSKKASKQSKRKQGSRA